MKRCYVLPFIHSYEFGFPEIVCIYAYLPRMTSSIHFLLGPMRSEWNTNFWDFEVLAGGRQSSVREVIKFLDGSPAPCHVPRLSGRTLWRRGTDMYFTILKIWNLFRHVTSCSANCYLDRKHVQSSWYIVHNSLFLYHGWNKDIYTQVTLIKDLSKMNEMTLSNR